MKAFIDDSGSGGDSPWFVLAGYLGTVDAWDKFDRPWLAVLDGPPKIEYFKSSEAESLRSDGQWKGITAEQRNRRIDALIQVIGDHATQPFCVRLQQKDYDEVIKQWVPPMWQNPYYFLFIGFLSSVTSINKFLGGGKQIEFIFDHNNQVKKPSLKLYEQVAHLSQFAGRIRDIHYEDEKIFLPLQAADLIAWQIRRRHCASEPPRRHYDAAVGCAPMAFYEHIISRDHLHELGEIMDRNAMFNWALMGGLEENRKWKRPHKPRW
ncbi:MAG TPA: DUF3800 domain-containing protein [Terracidiphilus sp.]|nr:DUF3800 domain-containing protein [Terracidiphilus sp.]